MTGRQITPKNPESGANMYHEIQLLAETYHPWMTQLRRDLHMYPEVGWLEMRTSALIARELKSLGYEVLTGRQVCLEEARMAVPVKEERKAHFQQIEEQLEKEGLMEYLSADMRKGFTGVIGILQFGPKTDVKKKAPSAVSKRKEPVIALRFDIDALPMTESEKMCHRPWNEGFASRYKGAMHACGHDCHTAIGLGTARILADLKEQFGDRLSGTVKLLFQPAEEGTRGAAAMVAAGHLDDVDYFAGTHVAPKNEVNDGDMTPGSFGSLATSKYDVHFHGSAAHAGGAPEKGKNALLAAAHAVIGLAGISRHSEGTSRINIGMIQGGNASNIVADYCKISMEVRGETTQVNKYMAKRAEEICSGAALMEGCGCKMELRGQAPSQKSSPELVELIAGVMKQHYPKMKISSDHNPRNAGSEDIGFMMDCVQKRGGQAVYMRSVTEMASPQHTTEFDVDEKVLENGAVVFASLTADLLTKHEE